MDTVWNDLRYAWRRLWTSPGFTLVILATLTLGVGATSSVASVVEAVLFQKLPFPDSERLVLLENVKHEDGKREHFPSSWLDFKDWRRRSHSFEEIAVHSNTHAFNLSSEGETERVEGEIVSATYFPLVKLKPVLGRAFDLADDELKDAPRHVILGYDYWQHRFGGDPQVLGRNLMVDGTSYEIIGILPAGFKGLSDQARIWLPASMSNDINGDSRFLNRRAVRWLLGVGRLKPGVTVAQAQEDMDGVSAALAKEFPDTNEKFSVEPKTLRQYWLGDLRFPLLTLLGSSLFVLLIAWTTVANLLLARAVARQREISVRVALGATRKRLVRQLLTESLLLSLLSCALGLLVAYFCTDALLKVSSVQLKFVEASLSLPVVGTILVLSTACGVFFGLVPAWMSLKGDGVQIALRQAGSSSGAGRQRFQSILVVGEVAVALFLLIGAGLMIQGFRHSLHADLGFRPEGLLTVRMDLQNKRYANAGAMIRVGHQYLERLQAMPGVKSAALVSPDMPTDNWYGNSFILEDRLKNGGNGVVFLVFHHVTPGYFSQMGMRLLEGRDFTTTDTATSPLAIVISQGMKLRYWPNENALGKRMRFGRRDPNAPWFTVVGVVSDLNQMAMQNMEWPGPDVYFALFQFPPLLVPQYAAMIRPRAGVNPLSLAQPLQATLKEVARDVPPYDVDMMEHRLETFTAKGRFAVLLMGLYAGIALALATAGLYGVLYYSVTQRTRELGIRVAVGAQDGDLVRLVVGRAAFLILLGLALGLGASIMLNRLFTSLLYGIAPTDLLTFGSASVLLFAVAMIATWHPARRAIRVPPAIALRPE